MIEPVAGVLIGIIVLQQVMIHRLVNKLMSRNYYEYQQSPRKPEPKMADVEHVPQDYIGRVFS